jgi:hypothetical protein
VQHGLLGWRTPLPDGGRGGDDRTDVYILDIADDGTYGYVAPDLTPGPEALHLAAYQVMDEDYSPDELPGYSHYLQPLQVAAAHEYNHILQLTLDAWEDKWMKEGTATWMEDEVYDDVNDYAQYLVPWSESSLEPLTEGSGFKPYGDALFNRFIDQVHGPDVIRRAWELSADAGSFAPGAYNRALRERGQSFFRTFTSFAAHTAEWRATGSPFEEGASFPNMKRALNRPLFPQNVVRDRGLTSGAIDHATFALLDVKARGQRKLTVGGTLVNRTAGALAIVGRRGTETGGRAVVRITHLPRGGAGKVTLRNASRYSRITAAIINADVSNFGDIDYTGDWSWRRDQVPTTLAVNDFTTPRIRRRTPRPGARGDPGSVRITFNEPIVAPEGSLEVVGPNGRMLRGEHFQSDRTVERTLTSALRPGSRYTVRLTRDVTDFGGNRPPRAMRSWSFTAGPP